MKAFVVDVNVAIVANGRAPQANLTCVSACMDELGQIVRCGVIVLDADRLILSEYQRHLDPGGQPGLGDAFMQWVWENRAVAERCERVPLNAVGLGTGDFAEFPDDPALQSFDRDDRKYVAVARASRKNPEVLNAVDPDWWQHRDALAKNGVRVRFLCPQHMQ
jgi:hypothetical protein